MTQLNVQPNPEQNPQNAKGAEVSEAQAKDIFAQAYQAQKKLQQTSLAERTHAVHDLIKYIYANQEKIIDVLVAETRKTRTDALVSEVMGVLDNLEWVEQNAEKILKDEKVATPITLMGKKSYITYDALGTVLVISPWNYPLHIGLTSIVAGFVAGNAVVFKPSEVTPMQGVFEDILASSPLVKDSVFVCYGSGETAVNLINQRPDKIFFTGSTRTGKRILNQAADMLIPVDLELGGKDPAIVFDDVNIKRAVAGVLWGAMTNAGQSCSSLERIYVQKSIYHAFTDEMVKQVQALIVNYGDTGNTDVGGMTASFQWDIVHAHVEDARAKGANILTGGEGNKETLVYLPTVVNNLTDEMDIVSKETFGPVIPIMMFDTEEEVVTRANNSEFGLAASVWSKDTNRAERVAKSLECGAVSINNAMLTEGNPNLPFGGTKQSGYGRQKGAEGLRGYTRSKSILVDKDSKKIEANWYPYTQEKYQNFKNLIGALFNGGATKLIKFAVSGLKLESSAQKPRDK